MMASQPSLTSPDGSNNGNLPQGCSHHLYSSESPQEHQNIPHHDQDDGMTDGAVPCIEEIFSVADGLCQQEDMPIVITRDGQQSRRIPEERLTCNMKDLDVPNSPGENSVTVSNLSAPDIPTGLSDCSSSKESLAEKAHVIPNLHPKLQSVENAPSPTTSEDFSSMEPQTVCAKILLALSKSSYFSFSIEPPDKTDTVSLEGHSLGKSSQAANPCKSPLVVRPPATPQIHTRLQIAHGSLDLTHPKESTHDKSHTGIPNIKAAFNSKDKSPNSKEADPFPSHTATTNIYSALNRPPDCSPGESSSEQTHADQRTYSRLHNEDKCMDPSKPKKSSSIMDHIPNIYSTCENTLDRPGDFTLESHPGLHSVDRSTDPSNLWISSPMKSHTAGLNLDLSPNRMPNLSDREELCDKLLATNINSEFNTNLEESCPVTPNAHPDLPSSHGPLNLTSPENQHTATPEINQDHLNKHSLTKRSPDPVDSIEKLHTVPNITPGLFSTNRSLQLINPEESTLNIPSAVNPNVNLVHQITDRSPALTSSEESSSEKPHSDMQEIHLGSCNVTIPMDPMVSCPIIPPYISSEPDSSLSDKSSVGSHTPPKIHSDLQTADRSVDPPISKQLFFSKRLIVTLNVHPESYIVDGSTSPSYPKEYSSMKSCIISPNIRSLRGRSPDPFYPDESSDICHIAPHPGLYNSDRSLSPSPMESSLDITPTITPSINLGVHREDRTLHLDELPHIESYIVNPNICSPKSSADSSYHDESFDKSQSSNIDVGPHSECVSLDPSMAEHSSPSGPLSVDSNVYLEPDSLSRSPSHSHPKELSSMNLHTVDSNIGSAFQSSEKSSSPPNLQGFSIDASHTVNPNIHPKHHSSNSLQDPLCNYNAYSYFIARTICLNTLPRLHRVASLPDPKVTFQVKSVLQDTHIGSQRMDISQRPSNLKESSSVESQAITPSLLSELARSHWSQGPSDVQMGSQLVTPNILPESHSLSLPDLDNPEKPPSKKSHTVTPTIISEPCSRDASQKSESEGSSVKKSFDSVYEFSDNSDPQEVSSMKPYTFTSNVDLERLHPLVISNSEKCPQIELHALTLNMGSGFNILNNSPNAPDHKQSVRGISGLLIDNTEQNGLATFSCSACGRRFTRQSLFLRHRGFYCEKKLRKKTRLRCLHTIRSEQKSTPSAERVKSQPVAQNTHLVRHGVHSLLSPSYLKKSLSLELHTMIPSVPPELHSADQCQDPSDVQEFSQPLTPNIQPELQSFSLPEKFTPENSHAFTPTISQEFCNIDRSPKSSELEEPSLEKSCDFPSEPHKAAKSPDNLDLLVVSSMKPHVTPHIMEPDQPLDVPDSEKHSEIESCALTLNMGSGFNILDKSPGASDLKQSLHDISGLVTDNTEQNGLTQLKCLACGRYFTRKSVFLRHGGICCAEKTRLKQSNKIRSDRKSASPAIKRVKSQSVTKDTPLGRCGVEMSSRPSKLRESSVESHTITSSVLPELYTADQCQDPSEIQEPSQPLTPNSHPESHSLSLPDSHRPEKLPPKRSNDIMSTVNPQACSVDGSPKSEPEGSSLGKSCDVISNIPSESHKPNRSTDNSDPQSLGVSNSKKRSQIKSHSLTLNVGSRFNMLDKSSDPESSAPSKTKQPLHVRSGLLTGNTEKNGFPKFSCSACDRCFTRQSIFLRHGGICCRKKLREKTHVKHPNKLQSDKKSIQPAKGGPFFRHRAVVLKEPNVQTPKKPFPCPECGKFYSQKSNLLQHRRIHTGVKPFSCLHCGKCFTKKISLVTHIRIHSGEKPFSCSQCGKCFGQKPHLDRHKKMHTGEKPYRCPECDKSFLQKCDLVKHRRIHAGLKPYLCPECGKSFTETSGLKRHRKLHR